MTRYRRDSRNIPRHATNTATSALSPVVHHHRGCLSVRLEVTAWRDPAVAAPPAAAVAALFRCNRRERREGRNLGGEQGGTSAGRACVAGQRVEAKRVSHGARDARWSVVVGGHWPRVSQAYTPAFKIRAEVCVLGLLADWMPYWDMTRERCGVSLSGSDSL